MFDDPSLLGTAANMRSYFIDADLDGDGLIDLDELKSALQRFYGHHGLLPANEEGEEEDPIEALAKTIMEGADSDGDGMIDFQEWMAYLLRAPQGAVANAPPCMPFLHNMISIPTPASSSSSSSSSEPPPSVYSTSWRKRLTDRLAAPTKGQSYSFKVTKEYDSCRVCKAPLTPGVGTSQMGFVYCTGACRQKHTDSTEFTTTRQRAEALSDMWAGQMKYESIPSKEGKEGNLSTKGSEQRKDVRRRTNCAIQ